MNPSLPQIAALVLAGAVGRGWELFVACGYDQCGEDPAALAVKGRLLKARARLASGDRQPELFAEAAQAYADAHALSPAPYLAINAATLRLLAGDTIGARLGASVVLALLDAPAPPADTPYFLAATRAEAWLLLGNQAASEATMIEAARADPDGWADRAATVAQLREISAALHADADWIDRFAPPASLHFAGHMGMASGGVAEAQLKRELGKLLARKPVGFAWGALAAGADIVMAETLIAHDAELHVVLPCPPALFEAQSVAPAGADWSLRYHVMLNAAASLRVAADSASSVHDPLATAHAGELAIGGALSNAATLASTVCQLIVADQDGGGVNTARQAQLWRADNGVQHRLVVPRDAAVEPLFAPEQPDPDRLLAVHVTILHDALSTAPLLSAQLAALIAPVSTMLADLPPGSVRALPSGWEAVMTELPVALTAIARLNRLGTVAVGAHMAISPVLRDAASGTLVPYGPAPALAGRLAALAQLGTALASDALAVTLAARGSDVLRSELYHPGEAELGGAVHILLD